MITPLRKWQDKRMGELHLEPGVILDLGSGPGSHAPQAVGVCRVDRNPAFAPDVVHDLEVTPLPFGDGAASAVLLINVLEHIYHARELLAEICRVLGPGGELVMAMPFLLAEHRDVGRPVVEDFNRFTAAALDEMLSEAGFRDWWVTAYAPGPFTAAVSVMALEMKWQWVEDLAEKVAGVLDGVWRQYKRWGSSEQRYTIGYWVVARK